MAATKIVIVAGQEFSVPAETDNEAIRQQLTSMGFADVASATVQKGTRALGEERVETVEFVKKAGTKGLDGAGLAAVLAALPRAGTLQRLVIGPTTEQAALVARLLDGDLTIDAALTTHQDALDAALDACQQEPPAPRVEGARLCDRIAPLAAVAAPSAPRGW